MILKKKRNQNFKIFMVDNKNIITNLVSKLHIINRIILM